MSSLFTEEMQAETQEGPQAPGNSLDQMESLGGHICPKPGQEAKSMKSRLKLAQAGQR